MTFFSALRKPTFFLENINRVYIFYSHFFYSPDITSGSIKLNIQILFSGQVFKSCCVDFLPYIGRLVSGSEKYFYHSESRFVRWEYPLPIPFHLQRENIQVRLTYQIGDLENKSEFISYLDILRLKILV